MNEYTHLGYTFSDPRATDFFRKIAGPQDPRIRWNAWYAAHKFGAKVIALDFASCRDGAYFGANAKQAAEYAKKHGLGMSQMYDVERIFDVKFVRSYDL